LISSTAILTALSDSLPSSAVREVGMPIIIGSSAETGPIVKTLKDIRPTANRTKNFLILELLEEKKLKNG
jgi:hypothetical protein